MSMSSSSSSSSSPLSKKSAPKRRPPPPPARPRPVSWSRFRVGRLSTDISPADTPQRIARLSALSKSAARNSRRRSPSASPTQTTTPTTSNRTRSHSSRTLSVDNGQGSSSRTTPTTTTTSRNLSVDKGVFPPTPTTLSPEQRQAFMTRQTSPSSNNKQDEIIQNLIEKAHKKMSRHSISQKEYNQVIRVALPSLRWNFNRQPHEKAGYLSKRSRWMHNWNSRYVRLRLNTGHSKRISVQKRTFGTSSTLPLLEWWDNAYSVVARGCVRVRGVAMCSTKEMRRMTLRGEVAYGFVVFGTGAGVDGGKIYLATNNVEDAVDWVTTLSAAVSDATRSETQRLSDRGLKIWQKATTPTTPRTPPTPPSSSLDSFTVRLRRLLPQAVAGFLDGHAQIRHTSTGGSGGSKIDAVQEFLGLGRSPSRRRRRVILGGSKVRQSARLALNEFDTQHPDMDWKDGFSPSPSVNTPPSLDFGEKAYQQIVMDDGSVFWTKEYVGSMFRELRRRTGLTKQFRHSMCEGPLRGGSEGDGKSGMLFFRSHDNRFIIKTLKQSELKTFMRIVQEYFEYFSKQPNTFISKFHGIYKIAPMWNKHVKAHNQEVVVVIMDNVFCGAGRLHHVFDLKGCTAGRFVVNPTRRLEISCKTGRSKPQALATKETLKDGNFDCDLYMSRASRNAILQQIQSDCHFLRQCNIMDYSLLLGVCVPLVLSEDKEDEDKKDSKIIQRLQEILEKEKNNNTSYGRIRDVLLKEFGNSTFKSSKLKIHQILKQRAFDLTMYDSELGMRARLVPRQTPARFRKGMEHVDERDFREGTDLYSGQLQCYFGVIDILQQYNLKKRIENAVKPLVTGNDPLEISAVTPDAYANRFLNFLKDRFRVETSSTRKRAASELETQVRGLMALGRRRGRGDINSSPVRKMSSVAL